MESINLVCCPNFTSFGISATNIIKQLTAKGVRVNLFPIHMEGIEAYPEDHELLRQCMTNAQLFDYKAPSVRIWHQHDLGMHAGRGLRVGYPIFELDSFNEIEKHHLQMQERIIVCSQWAKEIIGRNGIDVPTEVVPLGVDSSVFYPNRSRPSDNTSFYACGKKELRKAHDVILKCFERAFSASDKVELHLFWANRILQHRNPEEDRSWNSYYKNSKLSSKIHLYDWVPSQSELADRIRPLDCCIAISRAEGFDLPLLESFAMGKQAIVTDSSAHTEFATSGNSMLVSVDETELAMDGIWFFGSGNWSKLGPKQENQITEYMKEVHFKKQSGDTLFNTEGLETSRRLTWSNTADKLIEAIS
jgi:glycosyltransferase involved in cell wall biosynthesis